MPTTTRGIATTAAARYRGDPLGGAGGPGSGVPLTWRLRAAGWLVAGGLVVAAFVLGGLLFVVLASGVVLVLVLLGPRLLAGLLRRRWGGGGGAWRGGNPFASPSAGSRSSRASGGTYATFWDTPRSGSSGGGGEVATTGTPGGGEPGALATMLFKGMEALAGMATRSSEDDARLGKYLVYNLGTRLPRCLPIREVAGRGAVLGPPSQLAATSTSSSGGGETRTAIRIVVPVLHDTLGTRGFLTVDALLRPNPYAPSPPAAAGGDPATPLGAGNGTADVVIRSGVLGGAPVAVAAVRASAEANAALAALRRSRMAERFAAHDARRARTVDAAAAESRAPVAAGRRSASSTNGVARAGGDEHDMEAEVGDAATFFRDMQCDLQDEMRTLGLQPAHVFDVRRAMFTTVGGTAVDVTRDLGGVQYDDLSRGHTTDATARHAYAPSMAASRGTSVPPPPPPPASPRTIEVEYHDTAPRRGAGRGDEQLK